MSRRRVVVTGVGLVTPLGIGTDTTWDALMAGMSGAGPITAFDACRLDVRIAAEVPGFDPLDWLSSRKDTRRTDRFCQFAVAAAAMALEGAAFTDRSDVATVIGSSIGGARTIMDGVQVDASTPALVSPYFVPSSIVNMAAGTVARMHGFGGPAVATSTACASGADAIALAFGLVREGRASAALAGGTEACVVSPLIAGFGNMRALSRRNDDPAGASRPFDADRDGFVLGEGAGLLLLETAESAIDRGARVLAEIVGCGQTNDAYAMTAPRPDGLAAERAMTLALRDAGLRPDRVDYINAHGTSTPLLDVAETRAIKQSFGAHSRRLAVSSTKSMTGHLLGASGGVEAAVCALAIDRHQLPPTINLTRPDPDCDLDYVAGEARKADVDVALSNSFAFGGHNTSLVFQRFGG
ncbi:beta-ketoacyl-[acyl-carrier-protein] synthase II [Actinosynnema sp. ALI-1.44]|uniref:beta-ketoacyl-ACP synthase II n=1 Tax=Actinosynnema sp. ALI-1.44 TaxID=1933779 RepID=UPI00097C64B3|nr:beta-ketoacyl-ACP synthase II [Actinosynnema sp. ALI-1.44]ONI81486.1 beta-ketoacyl-[acyl-carrier-protein] synthase II [Actinosynnema sp. ALI-1.44]